MQSFDGSERLAAGTFVRRPALTAKCQDALERAQVVIVRGQPGVGKSRLVRDVLGGQAACYVSPDTTAEQATSAGRLGPPVVLDGFDDPAQQEALAELILEAAPDARLLLVTRSLDAAPHHHLDGPSVIEIEVPALSVGEVEQLGAGTGLAADVARRVHAWSDGLPFAVEIAVDHLGSHPDWSPGAGTDPHEVSRRLRRRMLPASMPEPQYEALCATALSRRASVELLEAVTPQADAGQVLHWLMARGLVESGGSGIEIATPLLRRVVLADVRHSHPWLEHSLRQRLADHVHSGATGGRTWLAADLVDLIESPTIRLAWGTAAADVRTRPGLPSDAATIGPRMAERGLAEWWAMALPFFVHSPERVTLAIDIEDEVLGYCIAVTPRNAPELAHADPFLGPRLAHAKRELRTADAVVFRDSIVFGATGGPVRGAMHLASIMRSDAPNPRYLYIGVDVTQDELDPFLTAVAAKELPDLRTRVGERDMLCFLVDVGPRGMLDASRGQILNELGQGPSPFDQHVAEEPSLDLRAELEEAVRNYQRPDLLAASALATAETVEERVRQIRAEVRQAADSAFGQTDREQRMREALERAYFDRAGNHDQAALDMHVSRTTYFRLVRAAVARTVDRLVDEGAFPAAMAAAPAEPSKATRS